MGRFQGIGVWQFHDRFEEARLAHDVALCGGALRLRDGLDPRDCDPEGGPVQ